MARVSRPSTHSAVAVDSTRMRSSSVVSRSTKAASSTSARSCPWPRTSIGAKPRAALKTTTRAPARSEEHTSELQSRQYLVCRLLLEKKKKHINEQKEYLRNINTEV